MRLLISGGTGLIGEALQRRLRGSGDKYVILSRRPGSGGGVIQWDPESGVIDKAALEGFDAVVHLAGESIAGRRWTDAQKKRIFDSRIQSTSLLATTLASLHQPPQLFVSSSAIGYYGDRGDEWLTEGSGAGNGFLSQVCVEWEKAAAPLVATGCRVIHIRLGVVLSRKGGALGQMLPLYRLGLGGKLGSGRQYWSWISLTDVIEAICFAVQTTELSGPVNLVGPAPVTNGEFNQTLASLLHRPALFHVPGFALRLAMGEMADELLLASIRVRPSKLESAGYRFQHASLIDALKAALSE